MGVFHRLSGPVAALAAIFHPLSAAADDLALNKEGYWTVGRGDADSQSCMASIHTDTEMLVLHAFEGDVSLTLGTTKGKLRKAKTGLLSTESYSFEFETDYSEEGNIVALGGDVNPRVLAALRLAQDLTVEIGGKPVFSIEVEGTGLEGALDAVIACSKGESGWWGPGVGDPAVAADGSGATSLVDRIVKHESGVWSLVRADDPGVCIAFAPAKGGRDIQIFAGLGRLGLGVAAEEAALPRGRKGRIQTDAYSFDFKPSYGGDQHVAADEPFDSQAVFALRRAQWIRITVDGRLLAEMTLENSGFAEVLDSAAACSLGESGWWGEGAAKP